MSNIEANSTVSLRRLAATATALISLPVTTHLGIAYRQPMIALAGIALFWSPLAIANLRRGRYLALAATLALIAMLGWLFGALSLLYAVPVAIAVSLFCLFASTLLPGHTPLITTFVELQYDSVTPEMRRYTRSVTIAWSVFFALMTVECILLALFAPLAVWSLFVNFLNYLLVFALIAVEFQIRRRVLRNRSHAGFLSFVRNLLRTDFRRLRKQST